MALLEVDHVAAGYVEATDIRDLGSGVFPRARERRRRRATPLSGGEAKMLSLARALVSGPVLLLVDEPSAGLAPRIAPLVHDELVVARARGVTVLLIDQT